MGTCFVKAKFERKELGNSSSAYRSRGILAPNKKMKILATADLHGGAMTIKLRHAVKETVPDLVLVCGDVAAYTPTRSLLELSRFQSEDVSRLDSVLDRLGVPAYFILGNDDWCEAGNAKHYLREPVLCQGFRLVPFEWVKITPFTTNREANENKLEYELGKIVDPAQPGAQAIARNMIVVAHMPPYGAGDVLNSGERCGSTRAARWIKDAGPKLWFCGHIHEDYSAKMLDWTMVLNCACRHEENLFRAWLVDTETMSPEKIRI